MKHLYFLIIIILFTFCQSDRHLDGIWIGSHEAHYSQSNFFPGYASMRYLIEFEEDKYTAKKFDFPIYGDKENQETHPFKKNGYILLKDLIHDFEQFGYDTLQIKSISSNRLILKTFVDYKREFIFKKIEQKKSPSINDLLEKTFILRGQNKEGELIIDSLDFVNDSILFHLGKVLYLKHTHWAINHYKDLSFLLINYIDGVPLLIKGNNDNGLILKSYDRDLDEFELKEIKYSYNFDKLYGSWIEKSTIVDGRIFPLPVPPENMNEYDVKLKLDIKKDSLTIDQNKRGYTFYWRPNSTNELIFIPELDHFSHHAIWKIKEVSNESLKIERIQRFSSTNETETIIFNRIKKADNNGEHEEPL